MRPLSDTRPLWLAFKRYGSLDEVKEAVRISEHSDPAGVPLRSVYWRTLLLFDTLDNTSWQSISASSRSAYESLRTHFSSLAVAAADADNHDLLENAAKQENPPRNDESLMVEIRQDVERCMPGIPFFQDPSTQKTLSNILFVFCKLNPDLGYRQGMHELVAPILWVVEQDAVDFGQSSKLMGEDALMCSILSDEYIEHDTFALFSQVMQNAKKFYEQTSHSALENPLVSRSQHIVSTLLAQVDAELSSYLDTSGIAPQIFLIRWIRLLFGREFDFADVLTVWDIIFAEDPSLEIVDYICTAMLLRIRWELLDSTYNEALSVLLHYPPLDDDITAQSIAVDALTLRANTTVSTGNRLVVKYTGRAMLEFNRPSTPPAFQRNITSFSGMDAFKKTIRGKSTAKPGSTSQLNFEALLQSTAQNILNRGEQLGIAKAVRGAIDDVHRKAQEIRETHVSSSPGWRQRPRSAHGLSARFRALEERNGQLAQLLDEAVSQLWEIQKVIAEGVDTNDTAATTESKLDLAKFSVAIGQVQYVQVYLQDATLPLTDAEMRPVHVSASAQDPNEIVRGEKVNLMDRASDANTVASPGNSGTHVQQRSVEGLLDPSDFDEALDREVDTQKVDHVIKPETPVSVLPVREAGTKRLTMPARPPLAESTYSWMLGQPKDDRFGVAKRGSVADANQIGTLFSDSNDTELLVTHKTRKGIRPRKKYATPAVSTDINLSFDS